jgi:hypothetical protein
MKFTEEQLKCPLSPEVRDKLIDVISASCAEAIFDDGYDSILDLIRSGCSGVEKYTDDELVAEYMEEFASEEDEV